jgi:hypothetical protein
VIGLERWWPSPTGDEGADGLIPIAMSETGLAEGRLRGELWRGVVAVRQNPPVNVDGQRGGAAADVPDPFTTHTTQLTSPFDGGGIPTVAVGR